MQIIPCHPTPYSKLSKDSPITLRVKSNIHCLQGPCRRCQHPLPPLSASLTMSRASWHSLHSSSKTGHCPRALAQAIFARLLSTLRSNVTSSKRPSLTTSHKVATPPYSGTCSITLRCLVFFVAHTLLPEIILSILFMCLLSVHPYSHGCF